MISSRSLDDLDERVKTLCEEFLEKTKDLGYDVLITSTYRDLEAQTALYQQGRSLPGTIVTNAKAGESFHNWRLAFDICPLWNGKCAWGDSSSFQKCGEVGESLGLVWAGRWTGSLREMAHLQWTGGLSIHDLQNGKKP